MKLCQQHGPITECDGQSCHYMDPTNGMYNGNLVVCPKPGALVCVECTSHGMISMDSEEHCPYCSGEFWPVKNVTINWYQFWCQSCGRVYNPDSSQYAILDPADVDNQKVFAYINDDTKLVKKYEAPAFMKAANPRNFWVEVEIDGRKTLLRGGPKGAEGGMNIRVFQRDNGKPAEVLRITGISKKKASAMQHTLDLTTRLIKEAKPIFKVKTKR